MQVLNKKTLFKLQPWQRALWSVVLGLWLLPLIAMQFSDEVQWSGFDFAIAGILLVGSAMLIELGCRAEISLAGRAGWALVVLTTLLLIWINLAVGIIGNEDNPANLWYLSVVMLLVLGALWAKFQPRAMSKVLYTTAALQLCIEIIIQLTNLGAAPMINIAFALLWLLAAGLLQNSTPVQPRSQA